MGRLSAVVTESMTSLRGWRSLIRAFGQLFVMRFVGQDNQVVLAQFVVVDG